MAIHTKRGLKKAASRKRILTASARLFRERGIAGASVDDVMAGAELTRGGFYAHFKDKADLIEHAVHQMFDESERRWLVTEPLSRKEWLSRALNRYLSPAHLASTGEGCALPALSAEIARSGTGARALTERTTRMIDLLAARLGGTTDAEPSAEARREAMVLLSTCIGAMTIARAMTDEGLARDLLESVRRTLSERGESPVVLARG